MKVNLSILILSILFATSAFSQTGVEHNLKVRVFDNNGDVISSSTILITQDDGKEILRKHIMDGNASLHLPMGANVAIEIRANGFQPYTKKYIAREESFDLKVILSVKNIEEEVEIEPTPRERRFADAISRILSKEEIEKLPESPDEIKKLLKRKYGDDVVMRIDGFSGGKFPSRSQIASISITSSPIDAEYRSVGRAVIDITTRVIPDENWNGSLSYSALDSRLNARNALAPKKLPESNQNISFFLDPPSLGKKTALQFSISAIKYSNQQLYLPENIQDSNSSRIRSDFGINPEITFKRNLFNDHTILGRYLYAKSKATHSGLEPLDLSERAFSTDLNSNDLRISESGIFAGKYNSLFKFRWMRNDFLLTPDSNLPTVIVAGEFNAGGAGKKSDITRRLFEFSELITFSKNKHLVKIGASVARETVRYSNDENTNGTFLFSSLSDFRNSTPLLFERRLGTARFKYADTEIAAFAQDYFSLRKFLQVGIGVRWDYQSVFGDVNNFSPRLSFVWSPEESGRLIFRGGYGRIYFKFDSDFFSGILANSENQPPLERVLLPNFPGIEEDEVSSTSLSISRLGHLQNPVSDVGILVGIFELSKSVKVTAGYSFGRGNHFPRIRDANAAVNSIRPNSNFGIIRLYEFAGNLTSKNFNLDASFPLGRIDISGSYSLSSDTADFAPDQLPSDNSNIKKDRGPLDNDRKHSLRFSANFSLLDIVSYTPFANVNVSIDNSLLSGKPYNLTTGIDENGDGILNERPDGIGRNSEREKWHFQTDLSINLTPDWFKSKDGLRKVSFSAYVNNLFNHNNQTNIIGVMTSSLFGQATTSLPARNIRFRINYVF